MLTQTLKKVTTKTKRRNMAPKVFADANLLLDFILQRDNYLNARNIILHGIEGNIKLYTTPAILHINAYWVTKAYGVTKAKELLL